MAQWRRIIPGTTISVGGLDVPLSTPKYDPKKLLRAGTAALRKSVTWHRIAKFNENHDEKGRFASGESSGSATGSTEAGKLSDRGSVPSGDGVLAKPRGQAEGDRSSEPETLQGYPHETLTFKGHDPITPSPYHKAAEVAADYMKSAGLPYNPPTRYIQTDQAAAAKIADAYDSMVDNPQEPATAKAYAALVTEIKAQYAAVIKAGLKPEFVDYAKNGFPYEQSPYLMAEDVKQNNHIWEFSTKDGFGPNDGIDVSKNPLLADSGYTISGQPATVNDLFRVVHDYFGHIKQGTGFDSNGEENAWRSHASMFGPEAVKAMTTETRGQNSWVNFGPFGKENRESDKFEGVHFAPQKIGLLPAWASKDTYEDKPVSKDAAIIGPVASWQKLPQQAQGRRKRPRFVVPSVNKDDPTGDSTDANDVDPNGRPNWQVPGYGQAEPQYPSQKPDGNKDTLFSKNINDKPPNVTPVDEDADYFLW